MKGWKGDVKMEALNCAFQSAFLLLYIDDLIGRQSKSADSGQIAFKRSIQDSLGVDFVAELLPSIFAS